MKKSKLKEYIKEQIINALSEATQKTTIDYKNPTMSDKILDIDPTDTATINNIKSNPNVKSAFTDTKKIKEAKKDKDDVEVKDDYYKVEDEDDIKPADAPAGDKEIQKKATKQDIIIKTYKDLNQILQRYRTAYDNAKNETDKQEAFQLLKKFSQSQEWKDAKEKYTKLTNIKL
jgi:hypothetical protein